MNAPEALAHVVWKAEQGFSSISTDHVNDIVKWARALETENAQLRDIIAKLQKER